MASPDAELKKISADLKHLSVRRQQLLERKKVLCIFQELRNRVEFGQSEEAACDQHRIDSIDDRLRQLAETKASLQKRRDALKAKEVTSSEGDAPAASDPRLDIFSIEPPPSEPAPTVILDVNKFPERPCKTQCPECLQFITTETVATVSSVTWLVCLSTALIGCVAGCCLIPFCLDQFKSITHRCPRCRSPITTIKKL